jgi:hypothetical protein
MDAVGVDRPGVGQVLDLSGNAAPRRASPQIAHSQTVLTNEVQMKYKYRRI